MMIPLLIAEDDAMSRKLIAKALSQKGYDVVTAVNGREAWDILQTQDIRLVIADWMMPEMDGLELVNRIRARDTGPYVYTILLTSRGGKENIVSGLSAGADDYITKPFHRDELFVRIRAGERIIRLEAELEDKTRLLAHMALVDGLTGVPNRRSFDENLMRLGEHSRRFRHPFSVLMFDLDRFKGYNDTLGHEAGDQALKEVGRLLQSSIRGSDMAFRYGGEEFVCLLPETDVAGAMVVAERVRAAIESAAISHPQNPPSGVLTVSIGVAMSDGGPSRSEDVVGAADRCLYEAKRTGRNRIVAQQPATAS
ncbi:MAG: diguanylate cyclase [Acidobacteriota bacterium]